MVLNVNFTITPQLLSKQNENMLKDNKFTPLNKPINQPRHQKLYVRVNKAMYGSKMLDYEVLNKQ